MTERAYDLPAEPRDLRGGETPPLDFASASSQEARDQQQEVTGQANEYKDRVGEVVGRAREQAATSVESFADRVREQAAHKDGLTAQATEKVADGMYKTAAYLKEGKSPHMLSGLGRYVRSHPVQSAGAAIAATFIVRRMLHRGGPDMAHDAETPTSRAA